MIARPRPRRLLDVALAVVALGFAAGIGWEAARAKPLPPPPAPAARTSTVVTPTVPRAENRRPTRPSTHATIAGRNLFSASRSETAAVAAAPAGPKPVLHGVLVDGEKSRAYLEDPVAKRVFGYAVGDTIGGGRLEQISDDRVVIRRPEGAIEVMLQDPAKPRPTAVQPAVPRPAPPPPAAAQPPAEKPPQ